MKLSNAQQRAMDRIKAEGILRSGDGVTVATIDVLERAGLVDVERTPTYKVTTQRGDSFQRTQVTTWVARLVAIVPATDLKPGDIISRMARHVEILKPAEDYTHWLTGQGFRYWARDAATGQEGWMTYGPQGVARRIVQQPSER